MIDERLLKNEERAIYALRALYRSYGYQAYKMSKFEEYDLYLRNKDFLISDRIITFNDTDGKLMALKPDVTLSIVKNGDDQPGCKQKVCYNENVYRVSGSTRQFKEIMQTGLECIGSLDGYDVYEVVSLAAQSLALVSEDFILDVSHLGILTALLDGIGEEGGLRREIAHYIAEKNRHDLERLCRENGVSPERTDEICTFIGIYGEMDGVLERLRPLCRTATARQALGELEQLRALLRGSAYENRIHFDFSIVNDMDYYNGIVFKGFLGGICEGVLSGGQYDKLIRKMGRTGGAVGFALYLDLLEDLETAGRDYDVDVLLLYDGGTDPACVASEVRRMAASGKSVSAQRAVPAKLRYRELKDLRKEGRG
ncbi:MAG: ATP phosphoribosyltransferase regulatory subunit [Oscillospiraceae bacterium]|nr:ATP phosphoribosyltransferase regulatory subunit [Oscillospiraceae bacterium]